MAKRIMPLKASNSSISSIASKVGSARKKKRGRCARRGKTVINGANGKTYTVRPVKCLRGREYVSVSDGDAVGYVPYEHFTGAGSEALQTLRLAGVIIVGQPLWAEIREAAGVFRKRDFKRKPLLDRPGWTKRRYFALASGEVYSPPGKKGQILFRPAGTLCRKAGSARRWKREVAGRLVGQHLAAFVLMTAFAAPLLSLTRRVGNFSFEVTGAAGKGKSTLQQILASTAGYPFPSSDGYYGMSLNATANGLETEMLKYSDMVMPLEEATLFHAAGSASGRASSLFELVFRSSDGTTKARYNDSEQKVVRCIQVLSGNQPLREVLGHGRAKTGVAAADRLITLPIDDDRPYGTFEYLPDGFASSGELADAIKATIEENHGLAIRRYLRLLVTELARDETKLKRSIERWMKQFRRRIGVEGNDGSVARLADAYGLVYAGGLLAKRYGILPPEFQCFAAARHCYRLHLRSVRTLPSFPERLATLVEKAVDLDEQGLLKIRDAELHRAPAYLRTGRSNERELLVTGKALRRAFPDWNDIKHDQDVRALHVRYKGRPTTKRKLRRNSKFEWVYRFRFPSGGD
ncbi:MAG TPA: DUF927 domain-containing protein [Sphingomicrobium sp.]|nr:DUF927 domain-containing protein [Sphingomicrobium sp.]